MSINNNNAIIIHNIHGLNWNNDLPLLYNLLKIKTNNNGQYLFQAGVSDKANDSKTSFPYNRKYWQSWKIIDCQHTSPDAMGTKWQAPNTNHTSPDAMGTEWQAPNTNVGQKTSPDEMESEMQAPNKNARVVEMIRYYKRILDQDND